MPYGGFSERGGGGGAETLAGARSFWEAPYKCHGGHFAKLPNTGTSGLKRWDEGRWVKGSLLYTLLCLSLFPIPHLPSSHLLSPLRTALNADLKAWCRLEGAGLRLVLGLNPS